MEGRDQKISVDPDQDNEGNVEFVNAVYETDYFPLPLIFRVGLSGELIQKELITLHTVLTLSIRMITLSMSILDWNLITVINFS